jgi:endo-1,4-beta-D-glucanase Y/4-amino-4-deoxy-L-arabinose transferase-like glycosyltransferase
MAKALSWRQTSPLARFDVRWLVANLRGEPALLIGLIAVALLAHGLNMFQFPSFTSMDDEGIYTSQAWAILREGQLSPYTYVYDHVPGGWILLAGWMVLTGGPHAFGSAIDSGRVLMLVLHVASVVMLYRVARKLGCGMGLAALGALLFTISPLVLTYGRRVLLDNIMLFWCLLSLDLLLDGWGRLSRVTLSGVCFGVAMLTKETAVFLVLPMLFIAWQQRWQHQARFAVLGWLVPMIVVVSWYPLYAALKGELLPAGGAAQFSTSGYGNTGVSLVDSLIWQVGRGGGGPFNLDNQFWSLVRSDWLPRDGLLLIGGTLATLLNLARGLRLRTVDQRRALATGLLGLLPLLYLARGGIVFDFYVLLAIPFLCLNLVVLAAPLSARLPGVASTAASSGLAIVVAIAYFATGALQPLYAQAPSEGGREALTWIKSHLPADAAILTGDDLWTDLREPGFASNPDAAGFTNVQSYTKVGGDPAIRTGVFHDDWHNVDYLVVSPGLEDSLVAAGNTVALDALHHAHQVQSWTNDGSSLELWKVDKVGTTETELLAASQAYLAGHFDQNGAFRTADGSVTSESQAYALLRAVWSGDRAGFARTWQWTSGHLTNHEGLLAWKWNGAVQDTNSATDADTDTALALLMAGHEWGDASLSADGAAMVNAIWEHDVAVVGGTPYVVAGDWAAASNVLAINPSYFAPYAYHIFQEVDPGHNWLGVVDSGYQVLFDSSSGALGSDHSAGLPPDWVGLDQTTGALTPLSLGSDPTTVYSYDAPRTYWRIALDQRWDNDGRAAAYLSQAGFLDDEVQRSGMVRAIYTHDGSVASTDSSIVGSAGALAALLTLDPDAANRLYANAVVGGSESRAGQIYWGDPNDLYAQEWGWFATALYADALTDVWHGGT